MFKVTIELDVVGDSTASLTIKGIETSTPEQRAHLEKALPDFRHAVQRLQAVIEEATNG